ncbi:MAG: PKD domain-containing protein, partial [Vicinamibacterales bacterium]
QLAAEYRITVTVTDPSGNLLTKELVFKTFSPQRFSKTIPGAFRSIDVLTQQDGGTTRSLVLGATRATTGYQVMSIDATDPATPFILGTSAGGPFPTNNSTWRIRTLTGLDRLPLHDDALCGLGNRLTGDVAMVTRWNVNISAIDFFVLPKGKPCLAGYKYLTVAPESLSLNTTFGTIVTNGYAKGVVGLPTTDGVKAYVAVGEVGVMSVDLSANVPAQAPLLRQREPYSTGNYVDVGTLGGNLVAIDRGVSLHVLTPSFAELASLPLAAEPRALALGEDVPYDADANGILTPNEYRDLAFVAEDGIIEIVDITDSDVPAVVASIPVATPYRAAMDYDAPRRRLAVSLTRASGSDELALIDVSNPSLRGLQDFNRDGIDDRVIWRVSDPGVESVRVDPVRGLMFVGKTTGFATDYQGELEIWNIGGGYGVDALGNGRDAVTTKSLRKIAFTTKIATECTTPTVEWEFGDGSRASTPDAEHSYATPGRYNAVATLRCGSVTPTVDVVVVDVAPGMTITEVRSAQQGDAVRANFQPGGSGRDNLDYIMVGARDNGYLYLSVDVLSPITVLSKSAAIVPAEVAAPDVPATSFAGTSAVLSLDISGYLGEHEFNVIAGTDLDGDGRLRGDEIQDRYGRIIGVSRAAYLSARTQALALWTVGSSLRSARSLLGTFLAIETPNEGTLTQDAIHINAPLLSHNTGLQWLAPDTTIPSYLFTSDSDLSQRYLAASSFKNFVVLETLRLNLDKILQYFKRNPTVTEGTIDFALTAKGVSFGPDFFALSRGFDLNVFVGTAGAHYYGTLKVYAKINEARDSIVVDLVTVNGRIKDLYDWEYTTASGNPFNGPLAVIQAGYPTLGDAGQIFWVDALVQGSLLVNLDVCAGYKSLCIRGTTP